MSSKHNLVWSVLLEPLLAPFNILSEAEVLSMTTLNIFQSSNIWIWNLLQTFNIHTGPSSKDSSTNIISIRFRNCILSHISSCLTRRLSHSPRWERNQDLVIDHINFVSLLCKGIAIACLGMWVRSASDVSDLCMFSACSCDCWVLSEVSLRFLWDSTNRVNGDHWY